MVCSAERPAGSFLALLIQAHSHRISARASQALPVHIPTVLRVDPACRNSSQLRPCRTVFASKGGHMCPPAPSHAGPCHIAAVTRACPTRPHPAPTTLCHLPLRSLPNPSSSRALLVGSACEGRHRLRHAAAAPARAAARRAAPGRGRGAGAGLGGHNEDAQPAGGGCWVLGLGTCLAGAVEGWRYLDGMRKSRGLWEVGAAAYCLPWRGSGCARWSRF